MFDSIGEHNSSDVKFLPYYRFMKILKFLCSGPISYVTGKIWKKSSAMAPVNIVIATIRLHALTTLKYCTVSILHRNLACQFPFQF